MEELEKKTRVYLHNLYGYRSIYLLCRGRVITVDRGMGNVRTIFSTCNDHYYTHRTTKVQTPLRL